MPAWAERLRARGREVRERSPFVDHLVRALQHYGRVNGNAQAGAVTYFGFLSFFPLLAIAFAVVGVLASVVPGIQESLVTALDQVLPGLVGDGPHQIPLSTFEDQATTAGVVGFVALLYTGLGWLSSMRFALAVMFELPRRERRGFVAGKVFDLAALGVVGVTLVASVSLSGLVTGLTRQALDVLGLEGAPFSATLLQVVVRVVAVAVTTGLFLVMFRLLAAPTLPTRALVQGAVVGAIGFEVLKVLSLLLIGRTHGSPAFQAFGVALILVLWINYFSRIVMAAAAWSWTHPLAVATRTPGDP